MQPFPSKRAPAFKEIPDEKWNDWRWQLSHRLNAIEDFEKILTLTESEREALGQRGLFRVDITPYFASLIDPDNPLDPIRKQTIPTAAKFCLLPVRWKILWQKTPILPCRVWFTATLTVF